MVCGAAKSFAVSQGSGGRELRKNRWHDSHFVSRIANMSRVDEQFVTRSRDKSPCVHGDDGDDRFSYDNDIGDDAGVADHIIRG